MPQSNPSQSLLQKRLLHTALALALSTLAATSHAKSGWYLGASVGNANVGLSDTINDTNIDIKDDDIGYKLYTGFKFLFVGVEGGYVNFGEIQSGDHTAKISGLNAFGTLSMGLGPVDVFGKVGGFVWDSNVRTAASTKKDSGFDPGVGIGASFTLGSLGLRAEYEYYDISEFDKVSMFSIGATFWLF